MTQGRKAIFPGTFDPVTNGHVDVARRAAHLFDEVVVAVYDAPPKNVMFNTEERVELFKIALGDESAIEVRPFTGLTVDLAHELDAPILVRGLRIGLDFEHEREMALVWRKLAPDVEVIMLIASLEHQYVSSTRVKEIASLGADVSSFVPAHVERALLQRIGQTDA
ncbi:MAG: pantetheine-phosphate adenylyltransferase [Chloroflexi bacterium]|nr:pantetheine-phosphate adenylyltransferase [Chloroflexota bacterium]MCH8101759.1 pantetheine-phosphate adenylyltransferase [Chloroflexota bacterium]